MKIDVDKVQQKIKSSISRIINAEDAETQRAAEENTVVLPPLQISTFLVRYSVYPFFRLHPNCCAQMAFYFICENLRHLPMFT